MSTPLFQKWAYTFDGIIPSLAQLLAALPYMPPTTRKVVATYARCQPPNPLQETRFYRRCKHILDTTILPIYLPPDLREYALRPLLDLLCDISDFLDPIIAGILITATISAPYDNYDAVQEVLLETWKKELAAAQSWNMLNLNYSSWLGPEAGRPRGQGAEVIPLHPVLPHSAPLSRTIRRVFELARQQIAGRMFYPKIGTKTIGARGQKHGNQIREDLLRNCRDPDLLEHLPGSVETIEDVERLYCFFGEVVQGPTEVRSAWRYNDLKPRVYYAQGPTAYASSKYIQSIFNILVDMFPVTHRKNRFSLPTQTQMGDFIRMAIYDYSSFTSRLTEIRNFLWHLAVFFQGTIVYFLDTKDGIVPVDLGQYLFDYLDVCNTYPEVDVHRCPGVDEEFYCPLFHFCGMLGVPGNISSCTLLHGLYLATLVCDLYSCRCVGDDAFVLLEMGRDDQHVWLDFFHGVQMLGAVEEEKTEKWDFPDSYDSEAERWHYVKRPLSRDLNGISQGSLVVLPALEIILGLEDPYHKKAKAMESLEDRVHLFCLQQARCLYRIGIGAESSTELGIEALSIYFKEASSRLRLSEFMPKISRRKQRTRIPLEAQTYSYGDASPVHPLFSKDNRYLGLGLVYPDVESCSVPITKSLVPIGGLRFVEYPAPVSTDLHIFSQHAWRGTSLIVLGHPVISVLKRLGICQVQEKRHVTLLDLWKVEDRELWEGLVSGEKFIEPVYEVTFVFDPPSWYHELVFLHDVDSISRNVYSAPTSSSTSSDMSD